MDSYKWEVSSGNDIISGQGTNTITVRWNQTGNSLAVDVSYTDPATGCPSQVKTLNVTVNPLPTLTITNPAKICEGTTADLTLPAVTNGVTDGLSYWTNEEATSELINPEAVVAGTYYIKRTLATGCYIVKEVEVESNPLPDFTVTNPAPLCSPATADLYSTISNASPGMNFTYWNASQTEQITNFSQVGHGTYWIKGSFSTGCYVMKEVTVVVNQTPKVTNTENSYTFCSGETFIIPLTADLSSTFAWTTSVITGTVNGATNVDFDDNLTSIVLNLTSTGTGGSIKYTVRPRSIENGCIGEPFEIIVNVKAPPQITLHPEPELNICTKSGFQLISNATGSPALTVKWQARVDGGPWQDISSIDVSGNTPFKQFEFSGEDTKILSVYVPSMSNKPPVYEFRAVYSNGCGDDVISNISKVAPSNGPNVIPEITQQFGCEGSQITISARATGDGGDKTVTGCVEYFDGTAWQRLGDDFCETATSGGQVTLFLVINSTDIPMATDFRVAFSGKCGTGSTFTTKLKFEPIITTVNACENGSPVTFTPDANILGGTWNIVNNPTQNANLNSSTGVFAPTTPGCFVARYQFGDCIDEEHFIVYPEAPVLNINNTCNTGISFSALPDRTGDGVNFIAEYRVKSPNSTDFSPWGTYAQATALLNNALGCWTIQARYKTANDCGEFPAGTVSDVAGCGVTEVTAFIFPNPPTITAPFISCGPDLVLPVVSAIPGFSVAWSINGDPFNTTPNTTGLTPGCYSLQAMYVNTAACGSTPVGTNGGTGCVSNTVYTVIFPPAPLTPVLVPESATDACGPFTVTPPVHYPGFIRQYSYDDGITWSIDNYQDEENCAGHLVRTRYILESDCNNILANETAPAACEMSPATLRKIDNTPPTITCRTLNPLPVCVNTGNTYVHSGTNWDVTVSDACGVTTPNVSLTGATILSDPTNTLNGVAFNIGTTNVLWTVSDGCNTNSCSFTVTVNPRPYINDIVIPPICNGGSFDYEPQDPEDGTVPLGTTYSWEAPVVAGIDNAAGGTDEETINGTLTNTTDAAITVTYTVTPKSGDCVGEPFTLTVTVQPSQECTIIEGDAGVGQGKDITFSAPSGMFGYQWSITGNGEIKGSATDETVTVTAGSLCDLQFTIFLTYKDANGCIFVCSKTIDVLDEIDPAIDCPEDFQWPADVGKDYATDVVIDVQPVFSDNCQVASLTWEISGATTASDQEDEGINYITSPYPQLKVGENIITYIVTDQAGNTETCSFTITVEAAPEITCPNDIEQSNDTGLCSAELDPGIPSLDAGATPITWTWEMTGATPDPGSSSTGDNASPLATPIGQYVFKVGVTTIRWTATNTSGSDWCEQTITITDDELPTLIPPPEPFEECVENLFTAEYNFSTDPNNDIDYDPNYPANQDYYIFRSGSELLDLNMDDYHDNCCSNTDSYDIEWRIDFDGIESSESISGTGQPSEYIDQNTGLPSDILLWGDGITYANRSHKITYWIVDCNDNKSDPIERIITIKPRPQIIKN